VSPKNSSWTKRTKYDGYAELDVILLEIAKKGPSNVLLNGDLNTRIGVDNCLIDNNTDNLDDFVQIPPEAQLFSTPSNITRNASDRSTNAFKSDLRDLVLSHQMTILNGRTLGDTYGNLTCHKWNGSSTVDYSIISSDLHNSVDWFSVKSFTPFSDHCAIQTKINLSANIPITSPNPENLCKNRAPKRFIISDEGKQIFKELQHEHSFSSSLDTILTKAQNQMNPVTLNKELTSLFVSTADKSFNSSKPWKLKKETGFCKPWYDNQCKEQKKSMNKSLRCMERHNLCLFHRHKYYNCKKGYFRLLRSKKRAFFSDMNTKIEAGNVLDWKSFKKLRMCKDANDSEFDDHTVAKFTTFFSDLYSDTSVPLSDERQEDLRNETLQYNTILNPEHNLLLNNEITSLEVDNAISSLKSGKSSSDDVISNDIIKCLSSESRNGLLMLFNSCLSKGVYPWSNSIITPLLKKGDVSNPDNYRAIAVGSCIGKLFSSVLLDRIISFKRNFAPDPPNQMGFTKGAQTIDHILTLKTVSEKYKKKGKKLYCVFVDLRKAFDSVPRCALLFKLAKMGIRGNIFSVIQNMYANSTCQLKLNSKLSNKINIGKGTEQGHTLSPELFKSYMQDVSPLLNFGNIPLLGDTLLSHLLWADDLVLMALDLVTAQRLFNTFVDYCKEWGLEVNESKTNLVIFNKKSLKENKEVVYMGTTVIKTIESYTYLGLNLHMNGSMTTTVNALRVKAMRAMYALRKFIERECLSFKSLKNLFSSLIKPILSYGAAIWGPLQPVSTALVKTLTNRGVGDADLIKLVAKIARDPPETVQLKYIKWALGVHKYASNIGCWGDSGTLPIVDFNTRQALKYLKRLEGMDGNFLVKKALEDQITHNLSWYSAINCIRSNLGENINIKEPLYDTFKSAWNLAAQKQTKLDFYRKLKPAFASSPEGYLAGISDYNHRSTITRLRISSHHLAIETGRYEGKDRKDRICMTCALGEVDSEDHFISSCCSVKSERSKLRRSLHIEDQHVALDAAAIFRLISVVPNELDTRQKEHLQQIGKMIHLMYTKKLKDLEAIFEEGA
jgi:hypothetical protein